MNGRLPIPKENYLAAFPTYRRVGKAVLRPVSVGDVIVLSRFGIDLGEMDDSEKRLTAYILSQPDCFSSVGVDMDFNLLSRRVKGSQKTISDAVNGQVNDALSTFVPGRGKKRMGGCGWPLEIAEFLCGEYGWSWKESLSTPLSTAFALLTVSRSRYGGENAAPDYIERQKLKRMMNNG